MMHQKGDLMDSKGIFLENPLSGNPYVARAAENYRGIWGLLLTRGEFFSSYENCISNYPPDYILSGPKKAINPLKPPLMGKSLATTNDWLCSTAATAKRRSTAIAGPHSLFTYLIPIGAQQ